MNSVGNDISKGRSMVAVIGGWLLARAVFWGIILVSVWRSMIDNVG